MNAFGFKLKQKRITDFYTSKNGTSAISKTRKTEYVDLLSDDEVVNSEDEVIIIKEELKLLKDIEEVERRLPESKKSILKVKDIDNINKHNELLYKEKKMTLLKGLKEKPNFNRPSFDEEIV